MSERKVAKPALGDRPDVMVAFGKGSGDTGRFFGWWYGYPQCCIEHHIKTTAAMLHEGRVKGSNEPPALHPERGHILCPACAAGPMAPLPERPADRGRLLVWRITDGELVDNDTGELVFGPDKGGNPGGNPPSK